MKKEITIYELVGLIKDGKAPKNIKYDDKTFEYDKNYNYISQDGNLLFGDYIYELYYSPNTLNKIVKILPEENDEWKDIEELQEEGNFKFYNKPTGMSEEFAKILDAYLETLIIKINSLIKNQKYLKEKLESKDESNKK